MAEESNIQANPKQAYIGMNLNSLASQIKGGQLSYALNAVVENFDGNQVSYQNESANALCTNFPAGFHVIGNRNIIEDNFKLLWLINPTTGESEMGKITNCVYSKIINDDCLGFDINHPILKSIHRKNECGEIEVYWVDGLNRTRYINLSQLPYVTIKSEDGCEETTTEDIDCNKLNLQPDYFVPSIEVTEVNSEGELVAGTYQFAIQYSDENGEAYTSYYTVTNPTPIYDPTKITLDFNYTVNKAISLTISNLDDTGLFEHFNLAVIKTINNISTAELVGTYDITGDTITINYTGQNKTSIQLAIEDIFAKYDVYDTANDITVAQDTLILADLTTHQRISYQSIANKIKLQWQTWRMPEDSYNDPIIATYLRGYMGDEVYPWEIVFLLKNGLQTDGFHIPGNLPTEFDLESISNNDVIDGDAADCEPQDIVAPRWEVYNTASLIGYEQVYLDFLQGLSPTTPCYKCPPVDIDPTHPECYTGPFQYGDFGYYQSTDTYPCNDIYGELSGQPIRLHRFPDSNVAHIHDNEGFIYPKGLKINIQQIVELIKSSSLTEEEKNNIQGFKIVRGNRANNKSIVAKGLLYNVGKYRKEEQGYFYPNYPFNDLREDPFILTDSNYIQATPPSTTPNPQCFEYRVASFDAPVVISYTDCDTFDITTLALNPFQVVNVCSLTTPEFESDDEGTINFLGICGENGEGDEEIVVEKDNLKGFETLDSQERYTFHSPDTSFFQPNLGNILKLETAEYGTAKSHFVQVKHHARYGFISNSAVVTSLAVAVGIGFASSTVGLSNNIFNGTAAWTALQVMLDLIGKLIPNKNFTYQQNSLGKYIDFKNVPNAGNKQRKLDLAIYLQPGMANIGDTLTINNYQRESSVYLKTDKILPYVDTIPGVPSDNSRYILSDEDLCDAPSTILDRDISAYYGSIKRQVKNQYGQLYSYETIDTGYQFPIDVTQEYTDVWSSVFGGDIFINRFALKKKYPFFLDNRVNPEGTNMFPNNSDIEYNELGNIGYPKFWFSTDIRRSGAGSFFGLFGVKETAFDCKENKFFYQMGKIYLFNYGVPYFYCESEVNVDLRQAFNDKEGDFFPRVASDIPDDWMQESYVTIKHDNSYYYNKTYSKQNKENFFSHLPNSFDPSDDCTINHPFLVIFSEDWKLFKPSAKTILPSNSGSLISIDGIEDRQVLARFENKTLLYNALLTAPTSAADVYLGQTLFSEQVPPLDYADTDLGYVGSQHKMLLKTEYGHVTTDAKRGQIFLIQGRDVKDLTADTEYQQVSKFFSEFFKLQIAKLSPDINIDNHYKDIGITGVFDTKYNRLIITKRDYQPLYKDITFTDGKYYKGTTEIELTNPAYFCNYSFTISYDFDNQAWISFHTYIPNYYIGDTDVFYTGLNGTTSSLWEHNSTLTQFNNFYNSIHPYIIEYPYSRSFNDEILQNIKDYSRILKYTNWREFTETDDIYFNKLVIYSNQQCSGILELVDKPRNNLSLANRYPIYNTDSKTITFTKSGSFYQVNTFWDMVVDTKKPIWLSSCDNLSIFKEINQDNMDYGKRSRKKSPFRSKELKIRYTLDNRDDVKIISSFTVAPTMQSHK